MVDITVAGAASGVVLICSLLYYFLWVRNLGQQKYRELQRRRTSAVVEGVFGSDVDVTVVDDGEEYGQRIRTAAENTTRVYRISGNAATFPIFDEDETFTNPGIDNRILILSPEYGDQIPDFERDASGLDAIRQSAYVDSKHSKKSTYEKALLQLYRRIENDDWDVDVRLYRTTPWLRAVVFDTEAGVMMSPNLHDFEAATKFWISDENSCKTLRNIFDDLWNDPETIALEEWVRRTEQSNEPEP